MVSPATSRRLVVATMLLLLVTISWLAHVAAVARMTAKERGRILSFERYLATEVDLNTLRIACLAVLDSEMGNSIDLTGSDKAYWELPQFLLSLEPNHVQIRKDSIVLGWMLGEIRMGVEVFSSAASKCSRGYIRSELTEGVWCFKQASGR